MEHAPPAANPPQAEAGDDADRLSALDDAALHGILALLPLRDAAATTVLSRRWPRVFATLPRLVLHPATFNRRDFDDDGDEDYCEDSFRWGDALEAVLANRAAPVVSFEVHGKIMCRFDEWFADILRYLCGTGGLQELNIGNTKFSDPYVLPSSVYSCKTLTSLELFCCRLRVPGTITGLRSVRSLILRTVVASDAELRRIISRCSAVEHLGIQSVHKARNIVIHAPRLETLEIYSYRPLCVSVKKAPRLDTVELGLDYGWPEASWDVHDTQDSDGDYSFSEMEDMFDFKKMAEREHKKTDEIGNMVTFLSGLGCAKKLRLSFSIKYAKVLSKTKVSMPKKLPSKCLLLGLKTLTLDLDHSHGVLATLVSCLLNSSPNLEDLRIIDDIDFKRKPADRQPLSAVFWDEQISAHCVQKHLSSVTYYIHSLAEGHPGGLCQYLVMKARVLKRLSVQYRRLNKSKPEDEAMAQSVRCELHRWPRASPEVLLETLRSAKCESMVLGLDVKKPYDSLQKFFSKYFMDPFESEGALITAPAKKTTGTAPATAKSLLALALHAWTLCVLVALLVLAPAVIVMVFPVACMATSLYLLCAITAQLLAPFLPPDHMARKRRGGVRESRKQDCVEVDLAEAPGAFDDDDGSSAEEEHGGGSEHAGGHESSSSDEEGFGDSCLGEQRRFFFVDTYYKSVSVVSTVSFNH
ncbi:hypothetical protein EJB05_43421, partial [Eragrostis curvula]